jgi:hypothetical protein
MFFILSRRINPLQSKTKGRVNLVNVNFFQRNFFSRSIFIVFMRRVTGPIPLKSQSLPNQKMTSWEIRSQDLHNLTLKSFSSRNARMEEFWCNQSRWKLRIAWGVDYGPFHTLPPLSDARPSLEGNKERWPALGRHPDDEPL